MKTLITVLLSAASLTMLFGSPNPQTAVPNRTLTFAERLSYQRAIEDVYWRHRIWPKERPEPKPSLDAVMSPAQLEKKVEDYLRDSLVLEEYWQKLITAEQLQAEMDRMARQTRQPEVLRELFEALGNDPAVIAECLARPVLAERLITDLSAQGQTRSFNSPRTDNLRCQVSIAIMLAQGALTLPAIASSSGGCTNDTWTPTTLTNAPDSRYDHTAVWTGSEMIVWGGYDAISSLNTGGRYDPSTDSWTATSMTNAPSARQLHTAVWTGSEMIVWGGVDFSTLLNTGGRYNPGTNTWTATSTTNAPSARVYHTAVWTGSLLVVWGGEDQSGMLNTGGRYNPGTNTWTTASTIAPPGRIYHTVVWTSSEMIAWGGFNGGSDLDTGGRYNPGPNTWTATSTLNAPSARERHTAVWTSSEMIAWGGFDGGSDLNTGRRYNPGPNTWTATSTLNAPSARQLHTAVWTGSEMIVWGGVDFSTLLNTGGRYDPSTDSWTATSMTNAPSARQLHTAVWTGSEMIVWGGYDGSSVLNTGGAYCAQSGPLPTPTPTPAATATPSTTPRPSPSSPVANPATFVVSHSFRASWRSVSGATGYRLDVATNNAFTNYVPGYQNLNIGNTVSRSVTGLNASTTYYYRVRAYNGNGTSGNSNVVHVTTLSPTGFPLVITNPATLITSHSARLNGIVDPHGLTTTVYFQYGRTTSYGSRTPNQTKTGNNYQNVFANISGLSAHTTYHFRIVATNSGGTRYGSDRAFTSQ